jgi:hypothetical protein
MTGRPRYTFDQCNDIVDDISGEMERADFNSRTRPAGGDATTDLAKTYDGLLRNIKNISNAQNTFNQAGRNMSGSGLAGWRVVQRWGDGRSFDQDLFIDPINNYVDRVWFGPHELQTGEDADYVNILTAMPKREYEATWPEGSGQSVSDDRSSEVYYNKAKTITIGEILYKKKIEVTIILMSDNSIYEDDDKFKAVKDELKEQGITEVRRRTREVTEVKTRLYDGGGWLEEAKDTVFDLLPVIPDYGNFNVSESKIIYWGAITKKMDAQRVYNYTESRKVEEGALAPRSKLMMTREQAQNDTATLATMNTNSDPVQLYTHVDGQNPPFQTGGATINPGLEVTSNSALGNLRSGLTPMQGQPVGLRSGVAVELEQNKSDTKNVKYFKSQETAICHTDKILINAIPKVYDTRRQVRVIGEDGSTEMVTLHDQVFDQDQQKMIELNDLSQGVYDVTCEMGPAFQNKQAETVAAFNEIATIDPTIIQQGKDVWFRNMTAPGMDVMAERARRDLFKQGMIPEDQMTDDEKEELAALQEQAQQNPPPEDPLMVAARAEMAKAEVQAQEAQLKAQIETGKAQLAQANLQLKAQQQENDRQKDEFEARSKEIDFLSEQAQNQADVLNTQADTLTKIQDVIIKARDSGTLAPELVEALVDQANLVNEMQDNT